MLVYLALAAVVAATLVGRAAANRRLRRSSPPGPGPEALGAVLYSERHLVAWGRLASRLGMPLLVLTGGAAAAAAYGAEAAGWTIGGVAAFLAVLGVTLSLSPQPGFDVHQDGVHMGRFGLGRRPRPVGIVMPFSDVVDVELIRGASGCARVRAGMRADAPLRARDQAGNRMRVLGDLYSPGMGSALHVWVRVDRLPEVPVRMLARGFGNVNSLDVYWSGPELLIGVRHPDRLEEVLRGLHGTVPTAGGC